MEYLTDILKKNGVSIAKVDESILQQAVKGADIVHSILPFSAGRAAARYCLKQNIPFTSGFHAQAENLSSHVFMMNFPLPTQLFIEIFGHIITACATLFIILLHLFATMFIAT